VKDRSLFTRIFSPHIAAVLGGLVLQAAALGLWLQGSDRSSDRSAATLVFLGSVLLLGLLMMGASAFAARQLADKLRQIARDAADLGHGKPVKARPSGIQETNELAHAINTMARELAGTIDELRVETALREQILASMREGVILTDSSSGLIYANPAAAAMFGRHKIDQVPPQLEGLGEKEFSVYHPVHRELRSTSVRLSDGRTLAVIQDETQRRRVEEIRRDFVANASHELKTPVSAILVTAETVEQAISENPEYARRFASQLVQEASRLGRLVQDLLDLARLEQRAGIPERVLLDSLVSRQLEAVHTRVAAKGLHLSATLVPGCEVDGLPEDLALMVRNLLDNAVAYTAEGEIRVELSKGEAGVNLTVSDTGVGIPTADLERIFERFYRVDKARSRDTGGTGLGLSIVRHVAERHGGTVEVQSELGHGSTFTVHLPPAFSSSLPGKEKPPSN
jgi:two-component system phosphate regulon sensor histidine kinase PhoR